MPPKRAPKKMMTLETKLKILKLKDEGKRNIDTVNELGVGESAVRKILQKRDEIKQAAKLYNLFNDCFINALYVFIYLFIVFCVFTC